MPCYIKLCCILKTCLFPGTKALKDAGVSYDDIEQAVVGYVYGKSIPKCVFAALLFLLNYNYQNDFGLRLENLIALKQTTFSKSLRLSSEHEMWRIP